MGQACRLLALPSSVHIATPLDYICVFCVRILEARVVLANPKQENNICVRCMW